MTYCTNCTRCCQLCGNPALEDCRDCRGEPLTEDERFWLWMGAYVIGLLALENFGREHASET